MRKLAVGSLAGLLFGFLAIQLVPYGRGHTNPPVTGEPAWPSVEARVLAVRACFDCHSNQTRWPWYTNLAPVSWLVQQDVERGRSRLNFSEWNRSQDEADDAGEVVRRGDMPPTRYTIPHPEARLSVAETQTLVAALKALGAANEGDGRAGNRGPGGRGDPRQQPPAGGLTPATPQATPPNPERDDDHDGRDRGGPNRGPG